MPNVTQPRSGWDSNLTAPLSLFSLLFSHHTHTNTNTRSHTYTYTLTQYTLTYTQPTLTYTHIPYTYAHTLKHTLAHSHTHTYTLTAHSHTCTASYRPGQGHSSTLGVCFEVPSPGWGGCPGSSLHEKSGSLKGCDLRPPFYSC